MPYCKTCPIKHCQHHPSKRKPRKNGGRSYYNATWGCPDNDTGKLNKHYDGQPTYRPRAGLEEL